MEKAIIKEKKIECLIGLLFLLPAILGVIFFLIDLFGGNGDLITLEKLSGEWEANWGMSRNENVSVSMPPAPLFIGLMAIAGVLLVKDSLRYLLYKNEEESKIDEMPISEPQQTPKEEKSTIEETNINEALGI